MARDQKHPIVSFFQWLFCTVFAGATIYAITYDSYTIPGKSGEAASINPKSIAMLFTTAVVIGSFLYIFIVFLLKELNKTGQIAQRSNELSSEAESLQSHLDTEFFTNLIRINFKYIDKYYLQTQQQANKSFLLALIASFIGFVIIGTGVVLTFYRQAQPSNVVTGAGVLSEFIAAIYFYLYNKTVLSMAAYHQKLVLTQNISLSLKITNDLPPQEKIQAQLALIESLTKDINHFLSSPTISDRGQRPKAFPTKRGPRSRE